MTIKPIVNQISTFDPALGYTFSFTYSGNQSRSNRLVITDNENNQIVYDNTVVTMRLEQSLPPNILKSDRQYCAQFQSIDSNNEASPISDKAYFYCLKTPTFQFSNLPSEIENSSYEFIVNYSQDEYEMLKEYVFYLWNSSGELISDSGVQYAKYNTTSISHKFSGLENNEIYYVQAIGSTVHGMNIDTGRYKVTVNYIRPSQYSTFYAENDPVNGIIKFNTNIIVIQYNGEELFEFDNGKIILLNNKIYYDQGFNIHDDFTVKIKGNKFLEGSEIFAMSNNNFRISLICINSEYDNLRFYLRAENSLTSYVLFSDPVILDVNDMATIVLRRKGNLFDIDVFVEFGGNTTGDLYYGNSRPLSPTNYAVYIEDDSINTIQVNQDTMTITYGSTEPVDKKNLDLWLYEEGNS